MRADLSKLVAEAKLKGRRFGCCMADPSWPENGGGKIKRGADRHYDTMSVREIVAMGEDVQRVMLADSHLYLWTTNNYLADAFGVLEAWGYRYVTCRTWFKAEVIERPDDEQGRVVVPERGLIVVPERAGLGQYFRGRTEQLLFGVRGKPGYRMLANGKRAQGTTDVLAPVGRHSQKPDEPYLTAAKVSPGPYLELFGIGKREGWTVWGDGDWHK